MLAPWRSLWQNTVGVLLAWYTKIFQRYGTYSSGELNIKIENDDQKDWYIPFVYQLWCPIVFPIERFYGDSKGFCNDSFIAAFPIIDQMHIGTGSVPIPIFAVVELCKNKERQNFKLHYWWFFSKDYSKNFFTFLDGYWQFFVRCSMDLSHYFSYPLIHFWIFKIQVQDVRFSYARSSLFKKRSCFGWYSWRNTLKIKI